MIDVCFTIYKNGYSPTTFIATKDGRIFADNPELGIFKHKFTLPELLRHVTILVTEGFSIRQATSKQIEKYSRIIEKRFKMN